MYLDTNFFIFAKFSNDKKGIRARTILKEITQGKHAITSTLALNEVMLVLRKNNHGDEIRETIEEIYSIENLEVKGVSPLTPLCALHYIEKHNLKPRDAFHAATMEEQNKNEIVTDDADFDKIKEIKRIKI